MADEARYVNDNLNAFAGFIVSSGVDARIILVGQSMATVTLCIDPPLGGPSCASNPPQYVSVPHYVSSSNGLEMLMWTYRDNPLSAGNPQWAHSATARTTLRNDAVLHFVAVTDDQSGWRPGHFKDFIKLIVRPDGFALATPEAPHGFVFHSIVGYHSGVLSGKVRGVPYNFTKDLPNTPSTCPTMDNFGKTYLELSIETGGAVHQVCESNWTSVFKDVLSCLAHFTLLTVSFLPDCGYHYSDSVAAVPPNDRLSQRRICSNLHHSAAHHIPYECCSSAKPVSGDAQCGQCVPQQWLSGIFRCG